MAWFNDWSSDSKSAIFLDFKYFIYLVKIKNDDSVEFVYGIITGSLGLTADAVHMLFDSTAIILSLVASFVAKWKSTPEFS